jgi:hypothetical protein
MTKAISEAVDRSRVDSHEEASVSDDIENDLELDDFVDSSASQSQHEGRPYVPAQQNDRRPDNGDDEQDDSPSARFSIRNPIQGYDSASVYVAVGMLLSAFAIRFVRKRFRGNGRSNHRDDPAMSWRSSNLVSESHHPDPSRPIQGVKLIVSEKCAFWVLVQELGLTPSSTSTWS